MASAMTAAAARLPVRGASLVARGVSRRPWSPRALRPLVRFGRVCDNLSLLASLYGLAEMMNGCGCPLGAVELPLTLVETATAARLFGRRRTWDAALRVLAVMHAVSPVTEADPWLRLAVDAVLLVLPPVLSLARRARGL